MRLTCPNCDAQYEVDAAVIPAEGRDVQCSSCGHTWFQLPEGAEPMAAAPPRKAAAEAATEAATEADFDDELLAGQEPEASLASPPPAAPPTPRPTPARRPLDEAVANVLQEEAAREQSQRQAEAQRMEEQDDLGLPPAVAPTPAAPPPPSPPPPPPLVDPAPDSRMEPARRDRLPDIEEINSTLHHDGEDGAETAFAAAGRQGRDGFRRGFLTALTVVILALLPYIFAAPIASAVPALAPALGAYSSGIDGIRSWLDSKMQSTTDSLRSKEPATTTGG